MFAPSTTVVIPCFNEAPGIGDLIDEVLSSIPQASIVIIDDNSPDGTAEVAASRGSRVTVIRREGRLGLASAIHAGLKAASTEVVIVMDGDGSHEPKDALRLIDTLRDADLAVGSRWMKGGTAPGLTMPRTAWSRGANSLVDLVLGYHINDWTAGFFAIRGAAIPRLTKTPPQARGWAGSLEIKFRALCLGLTLVEIPVTFGRRRHGTSKLRIRDMVESLVDLFAILRNRSDVTEHDDGA